MRQRGESLSNSLSVLPVLPLAAALVQRIKRIELTDCSVELLYLFISSILFSLFISLNPFIIPDVQESKAVERQAAIDSIVERNPEAFKYVNFITANCLFMYCICTKSGV